MTMQESVRKILSQPKDRLGDRFYERFFIAHPEYAPLFRETTMHHQATFLAVALHLIAGHAEHPTAATTEYLKILGHRHDRRGIRPDMFPAFQEVLLETLEDFLQPDWTPDLAAQWRAAIERAAECMRQGYVAGAVSY